MATPYYEHGGITIYHGDCREILPTLAKADLVLTDPPYGVAKHLPHTTFGRDENRSRSKACAATDWGRLHWDEEPPSDETLMRIVAKGRHAIIFGGNYFALPPSPCWLVWDKDNSGDFADCELAWTNIPAAVRKFRWRWNGMLQEHGGKHKEHRHHPTQKPLAVMKWCIERVPGDPQTILDPFMGSGTTLRAAKDLGRKAIGIEIEERYCEIAAKRLAQEVLPFA